MNPKGSILNRRQLLTISIAFLLSGCANIVPSIPGNYSGPQAQLDDSAIIHTRSKADFFVAESLDANDIDNAMRRTFQASQGNGFGLNTVQFGRPIIAGKSVKIGIKGRTIFAAPILALTGTV